MTRKGYSSERLADFIRCLDLPGSPEEKVQEELEVSFLNVHVPFVREFRLSKGDRVDFFVEDSIAVEVKLQGSLLPVVGQLSRYAEHDRVKEIILVTAKMQLIAVPRTLRGKPVTVVNLLRGIR